MTDAPDGSSDPAESLNVAFPDSLAPGTAVLVAGPADPTSRALCLRALCQYGAPDEPALVVTTTEGATETRNRLDRVCPAGTDRPLAVVDAVSKRQYLPSIYTDEPTVFIASPGDLERIVLGLSDLTEGRFPRGDTRHLLVRSLTPLLKEAPVDRVRPVIERITGLRTGDGYGFFGLDFTAHDEDTIAELTACVDGILWFRHTSDGAVECELRSTRAQLSRL